MTALANPLVVPCVKTGSAPLYASPRTAAPELSEFNVIVPDTFVAAVRRRMPAGCTVSVPLPNGVKPVPAEARVPCSTVIAPV